MGGRETRHGAVVCLVTLTTLALQHRAASGAQIRRLNQSGVPFTVFVTGKWASDAPEIQKIEGNMQVKSAQSMGQQIAEMRYAKWVPIGSKIHYYTDEDMAESAREISQMLRQDGVTQNAFGAFSNLRPPAYRADLWRYMALWAYGGVYLDANIMLMASLDHWINFEEDRLVLVQDLYAKKCAYWNAMMAAPPEDIYLAVLIRYVVDNVEQHFYGDDALGVTGPIAVCAAFKAMGPEYQQDFESKHLRCDLEKGGNGFIAKVTQREGSKEEVARKDERLHHFKDPLTHYGPMWDDRKVYCDELDKPETWSGKCGPKTDG